MSPLMLSRRGRPDGGGIKKLEEAAMIYRLCHSKTLSRNRTYVAAAAQG